MLHCREPLIAGPKWALPVFIAVLVTPTVVSHRTGKQSLNRVLGIIVSSVITLALLASVGLLVASVPTHKEEPVALLRSGAQSWLTNVLVFALWLSGHWMVADRPLAVNCTNLAAVASSFHKCRSKKLSVAALSVRGGGLILSILFYRLDDQFDLRSHRRAFARPMGKDSRHGPDRNLINDRDCFDFARGRSALKHRVTSGAAARLGFV